MENSKNRTKNGKIFPNFRYEDPRRSKSPLYPAYILKLPEISEGSILNFSSLEGVMPPRYPVPASTNLKENQTAILLRIVFELLTVQTERAQKCVSVSYHAYFDQIHCSHMAAVEAAKKSRISYRQSNANSRSSVHCN